MARVSLGRTVRVKQQFASIAPSPADRLLVLDVHKTSTVRHVKTTARENSDKGNFTYCEIRPLRN